MEGFTYHNIFDTKGIEYLVIIGFFAVLIPFWLMLNREKRPLTKAKEIMALSLNKLRIPQGLLFSKNHTWLHMQKNGLARVGLDDLLMHLTGEASIEYLVETGASVKKGEAIAEIVQGNKKLRVLSPVSGEIIHENGDLEQTVRFTEMDFTESWMVQVRPTSWLSEIVNFKMAQDAADWLKNEIQSFKDFVAQSSGAQVANAQLILQDGGELRDQTLSQMGEGEWKEFQKKFMDQVD